MGEEDKDREVCLARGSRVKKIAAGIKIQLLIVSHYLEEEREKENVQCKKKP